jgi:tRNA(Ile)-lysidine synthase
MEVEVPAGKYIIAVSGGVDSMVLLDILRQKSSLELVVAHFNHGIRGDSAEDEHLVRKSAEKYGLTFEVGYGKLGKNSSEEKARKSRYKFLESVKTKYLANGIITAHHQDDLIETALINILRGSGHRGLVAMRTNPSVIRPLVHIPKSELIEYAKEHKLEWHDDYTNEDEKYLRNYIRKNILNSLTHDKRTKIISNIEKVAENIAEKDDIIAKISQIITTDNKILRTRYIMLPLEVRRELVLYWLRSKGVRDYAKQNIENIDIALKTAKAGTRHPVKKGLWLRMRQTTAEFESQT